MKGEDFMENLIYSDGSVLVELGYQQTELTTGLEQTDGLNEPVFDIVEANEEKLETDEPLFGSNLREAIQIIRGS